MCECECDDPKTRISYYSFFDAIYNGLFVRINCSTEYNEIISITVYSLESSCLTDFYCTHYSCLFIAAAACML